MAEQIKILFGVKILGAQRTLGNGNGGKLAHRMTQEQQGTLCYQINTDLFITHTQKQNTST